MLRATRTIIITDPDTGIDVTINHDQVYDPADPVIARIRKADASVFSDTVEQATAAPGERRNVRR